MKHELQVFGESILNDAVAIVLTTTVLESDTPEMAALSTLGQISHGVSRFLAIFLGSAVIGVLVGLVSSLVLKVKFSSHLRKIILFHES